MSKKPSTSAITTTATRRWHYRPVVFADPQLELKQVR